MAQRLVRTICPDCKVPHEMPSLDVPTDFPERRTRRPHFQGQWLLACRQSGFRGRTGIYELMVTDDEIREMCVQRVNASHIRNYLVKNGMVTLRQDGWRKVLKGVTTIDEIARVTAGDIVA